MGGAGWAGLWKLPPQPKKHLAVWGEVGGCLRVKAGPCACRDARPGVPLLPQIPWAHLAVL